MGNGIFGVIRSVIKFPLFAFALFIYFIISFIVYMFCGFDFVRARPHLTKIISLTSRVGLKIIGITVTENIHPVNPNENYLLVSNHLSYIDVLVISRFYPSCFVTSKEMKETFFLGHICMLGGCLFVDRKNRSNLHKEVQELTEALRSGLNVAIFPEATSTNGEGVIRFRRPLFQAAFDADSKVLPVCLNYRKIDNHPVTLKNRDTAFWYGDMTFFSHAVKLFSHKKMLVELTVLPAISAHDFADKVELSEKCYEIVSSHYTNIIA